MTRIGTKWMALALLLSGTGIASAEYSVPEPVRERLETILKRGGGELTYFAGPSEMIGVGITMRNGQQMVVYATPDGDTVFSGVAVDTATGENRTRADIDRMPPPDFSPMFQNIAESLSHQSNAQIKSAMYAATEGADDAENVFYVFIDPKCPFCHSIKRAFDTVKAQGHDVAVHYIPIGILGPESQNLASAMAGSNNDTAMRIFMAASENSFRFTNADVIGNGSSGASANLAMFRSMSFEAVPVVISRSGGQYFARQGGMSVEMIVGQLEPADEKVAHGAQR